MEEVSINTESFLVIIRAINEDLFVVLVILKEGNYGKGRYLLKINSPELYKFLE
jgi:predicted regulator of Ras-like GTPase activity (Roadblock/LC7/MglB family)